MHKIYSLAWRARLDLVFVNLFSFFPLHFFIGRKSASFKMPNFPLETSTDESFSITQLSRLLRSAGETFALLVSSRCWREMASAWTASESFLLAIASFTARQDRYENKYNSTGFFLRPSRERQLSEKPNSTNCTTKIKTRHFLFVPI